MNLSYVIASYARARKSDPIPYNYPPPHPNDFSNRPGFVSRHCHCSLTDGVCFITIQGQRMGCYELDDRAAQRSLLKQVYRACQATQAQLWERIGPRYPNHAKEGRKLIAAALSAPGSMRLQPGQIGVELAPQPPPTALEWSPNFVKVST